MIAVYTSYTDKVVGQKADPDGSTSARSTNKKLEAVFACLLRPQIGEPHIVNAPQGLLSVIP